MDGRCDYHTFNRIKEVFPELLTPDTELYTIEQSLPAFDEI
jgi:hypothetical protein